LANRLGLTWLGATDWSCGAPRDTAAYDDEAWANEDGKAPAYEAYAGEWRDDVAKDTAFLKTHSLTWRYLRFNDQSRITVDSAFYVEIARFSVCVATRARSRGTAPCSHGIRANCLFELSRDGRDKPTGIGNSLLTLLSISPERR
jgi:hypothetical protein